MAHERDERWAYVALAVLAVAYIVYRFGVGSGLSLDFAGLSISMPDLNLGKFGKNLPYLFAPLFAVVSEVLRRRKAKAVLKDWENRARTEGFLREEKDLKIRFVEGGKGSVQGDLRLTRAALYIVDKSGRRDPMRFLLASTPGMAATVLDVSIRDGSSPEFRRVRVIVGAAGGGSRITFEFESHEGEAWRSSLKRALGQRTDSEKMQESPGDQTTT